MFDFFKMISKSSNSQNPSNLFANVSIINLNYDRCLEQFFISAASKLYNIEINKSAELVKNANIVHPYGHVGELPIIAASPASVAFGDNENFHSVTRAADLIKTYTEQVNSENSNRIAALIASSLRIVFLGFGFHKQNIDLLGNHAPAHGHRTIYGTAIGESAPNVLEYAKRLRAIGGTTVAGDAMPGNVTLDQDLDCMRLIQSYREVLSS